MVPECYITVFDPMHKCVRNKKLRLEFTTFKVGGNFRTNIYAQQT